MFAIFHWFKCYSTKKTVSSFVYFQSEKKSQDNCFKPFKYYWSGQSRERCLLGEWTYTFHCCLPYTGWGRRRTDIDCRAPCIWRDWRKWSENTDPHCANTKAHPITRLLPRDFHKYYEGGVVFVFLNSNIDTALLLHMKHMKGFLLTW